VTGLESSLNWWATVAAALLGGGAVPVVLMSIL
jgi:hypothetical protein